MADVVINLGVVWEEEAGDGSKCIGCGDAAWLTQKRLVLLLPPSSRQPQDIVLCASCADACLTPVVNQ